MTHDLTGGGPHDDGSGISGGDAFYTVPELCRLLKISRATVYRRVRSGEFPHVRIGTSVRFPADAVDEVLRRNQAGHVA